MRLRARKKQPRSSDKKGAIAVIATLLVALFCVISVPAYVVRNRAETAVLASAARSLPVYSVETQEKKVAISFDCAWGVEYTQKLLDIMEQNDVRCTFFAVQFWVEKYPQYAAAIVEAGHELGTHSRTHSYMSKLSEAEIIDELKTSCEAIEKATGQKTDLFRAPYGDYNNLLIDTAKSMGLYTIQWDVDSLDWKNLSATEIAMRIINGAKNGSIILCHNNGLHTAEALPLIFSTLKNRGYEFVPIGELIYKSNYTIDANGRQHANA
ncbi:MAG: polysaccharide deacetylase family protein [Clostridia bacterium]|nr:polysaccharide deacetylase family protein [Clostridia bacterium]